MIDLRAIFKNRRLDESKLLPYGFRLEGKDYVKDFPIMQGQFVVKVVLSRDGAADFTVFDLQTQEEYYLAKVPDATGAFVGEVHAACEAILSDIAAKCFYADHYACEQTKRIMNYMQQKYNSAPEFLWKAYPDYAVFRVPGGKPWFALVGKVEKSKLGLPQDDIAEIVNLKNDPAVVADLTSEGRVFPAYHMNKRCWLTIVLDDRLPDSEIASLIDVSFDLVK